MLKKTKTAVITALATMLSTVSPLATFAENVEPVETIPERAVTQELHTCVDVPEVLDGEPVQTYLASTTATIPDRVYTCTTRPVIEVQPEEFPLRRTYDVNVNVVDSKTNEHVDGVKVHFVETQDLQSNVITRDYGTWDSSESESYSIDIIQLFTSLHSTVTLTAVIEDLPEGYSYLGGDTVVQDFIVDTAIDWYYDGYYGYEHQPRTDLTIYLDKEYHGSVEAICHVIDGDTGEHVEGVEVSLSEWDENGNLGNCVEWITTGKEERVNFEYTLPSTNYRSIVQFVADKLPEKYSKYTFAPFEEKYVYADSTVLTFVMYLYEDGHDYDFTNTMPVMTTTTSTTTTLTTVTSLPHIPTDTETTTSTPVVIGCKACDICGMVIDVNDGVTTPLGVFVCPSCKSAGAGGTRPQFPTDTVTATTTTAITSYIPTSTTPYDIGKGCDVCYKFVNVENGVYTPTGFVCKDCYLQGAGGTTAQTVTATTATTTTTIMIDKMCQSCGCLASAEYGVTTSDGMFICSYCYQNSYIGEINTNGGKLFFGDANCDEDLALSDAVLIMQSLANPDQYKLSEWGELNADVYNRGDGITPMDALTVQMVGINLLTAEDLPVRAE